MNILVLGGTRFVGRHVVEAAVSRGHAVTIFHRGSHPPPWRGISCVQGDRNEDLSRIGRRTWDAVIDSSGYHPRTVKASCEFLAKSCGFYVFISTISVYAEFAFEGTDEDAPLAAMEDGRVAALDVPEPGIGSASTALGSAYGPLKARCEHVVRDTFAERALVVRPGLVAGPFDAGGRLTYWAARIARGGEVLAPATPQQKVRLVDARDLGEWIVACIERAMGGVFNAPGGEGGTLGRLLGILCSAAGSNAVLTWVDQEFLREHGVVPWDELPLWLPEADQAFFHVEDRRARDAGLRYRSLTETVEDVLTWYRTQKDELGLSMFLTPQLERCLLDAWHARRREHDS